jgi:hypothetical protein
MPLVRIPDLLSGCGTGSGSRRCEPAAPVAAAVLARPGSTCCEDSSTASVVSASAPTGRWGLHPGSGSCIRGTINAPSGVRRRATPLASTSRGSSAR